MMQRIIFQVVAGIMLLLTGGSTGFVTLKNFNNDNSLLFVILEVLLIGIGIFCLSRAIKGYARKKELAKASAEKARVLESEKNSRVERFGQTIAEYEKASAQKDQMR